MKTPTKPKPNEMTIEWGLYCHAESRLYECQAALERLVAEGWTPPMKDQEERIQSDTKMKDDAKAAKMTHERRVERMIFWKAVFQGRLEQAETRLREAEWTMEHWDEQPVLSIRRLKVEAPKAAIEQGLLF